MMMRLMLCIFIMLCSLVASAEITITGLLFSEDGGKNWTEDPPILSKENPKFSLKVNWDAKESRPMVYGGYINFVLILDRDFGSSNAGGRCTDFETGSNLMFGQTPTGRGYWIPGSNNRPFLLDIDLGGRKEGTFGWNGWDYKTKKYCSKPVLPACDALTAGTYIFKVFIYYRLTEYQKISKYKDSRLVVATETFPVLIK